MNEQFDWAHGGFAVGDPKREHDATVKELGEAVDVLLYIASLDPQCLESDLEIEWYHRAKAVVQKAKLPR